MSSGFETFGGFGHTAFFAKYLLIDLTFGVHLKKPDVKQLLISKDQEMITMKREMFIVIAYDIVSNKRRNNVVKMLKDYGGQRMNYSVFECRIETAQFKKLRQSLLDLIQEKKDRVLIYEICKVCRQKTSYLGAVRPRNTEGQVIIL